jgi:hypothetical protein
MPLEAGASMPPGVEIEQSVRDRHRDEHGQRHACQQSRCPHAQHPAALEPND